MHRMSRELLQKLENLAKQNNITTIVTLGEIYQCDQLVMKYYINPVLNVIENKLKHVGKKTSKHFSIQYWVTIIETTLGNNDSVQRDGWRNVIIDKNTPPITYHRINNYMPCDYGDNDTNTIIELMHKYSDAEIMKAINVGKSNNVYSIQYVKAVIEREQALSNIQKQKIEDLANKAESAVSVLDKPKVDNTVMDVASAVHNWDKAKKDAELIAQFNAMFGGDDNG